MEYIIRKYEEKDLPEMLEIPEFATCNENVI